MKKQFFARLFMLVCLVMFAQLAQGEPKELISIPVKNGKTPRFSQNLDYGSVRLRRLVFEGETADDWTESLEMIIGQRAVYPPTVSEMFSELMAKRMKKQLPEYEMRNTRGEAGQYALRNPFSPMWGVSARVLHHQNRFY
ncbi:MAG: hypothetical protein HGA97_09870, partial [Chlorobiaceae bacterium]|nr:hypothetical protein [Chlorobiaceae bacterium]